MSKLQFKVVITGAESTGKSQLSQEIEAYYNGVRIPEFARLYIENLAQPYTYDDIETIAKKQIEEEIQISDSTSGLIVFDTWLIITKVWFEFVYGYSPDWLSNAIEQSNIDLFLVCDTNLPWIPDPVRENGGENRLILQQKYIEELQKYNFKFEIVGGIGEERIKNAIQIIDKYRISEGSI